jgi:hypothetical protein
VALREKARQQIRERLLIVERFVARPWFLVSGFSTAFAGGSAYRPGSAREAPSPSQCAADLAELIA